MKHKLARLGFECCCILAELLAYGFDTGMSASFHVDSLSPPEKTQRPRCTRVWVTVDIK